MTGLQNRVLKETIATLEANLAVLRAVVYNRPRVSHYARIEPPKTARGLEGF